MLNEPTLEKLRSMRLTGMAEAWLAQQQDPEVGSLSFDERFALLIDTEMRHRENRRLKRLLTSAKLRLSSAVVEDIRCSPSRGVERASYTSSRTAGG